MIVSDALAPQSTDPNVLAQWPAALHMLGHIYNNNLCVARIHVLYALLLSCAAC